MQMWVLKPACPFVLNQNYNSLESLHFSFSSPSLSSSLSFLLKISLTSVFLSEIVLCFFFNIPFPSPIFMASWKKLLMFSTILVVLCRNGVFCYGEKEVLSLKKLELSLRSSSTTSSSFQKSWTKNGATVLEMRHKDYYSGVILDRNERLKKHLQADIIRVQSIQNRIRSSVSGSGDSKSQTQVPITSGVNLHTLNYVVPATLGGRNMTVIMDTGSDLTWVQCQPCRLCYNQPEPLFDPKNSSSYHAIPCKSSACQSLQFATGNLGLCGGDSAVCNYAVNYGDGSYTRGELGSERLVLGSIPLEDFVFGCGRNNKGLFGAASGLMGLGRSDLSLISQTSDTFGGVFSYCLPDIGSTGSLILGSDASFYKNSTPFSYTKMVSNPQQETFYFLNLTGISIGEVATDSPSFGRAGILIDSGTVISRLPRSIYQAVRTEFLKQFSGYPPAPSFSILDTCFNLSAYNEVEVPTIIMNFEGDSELVVDVVGTVYVARSDASQVCLAFASLTYEDEIGIVGNFQQRNNRVVYDTKESRLGFAKETCSFFSS